MSIYLVEGRVQGLKETSPHLSWVEVTVMLQFQPETPPLGQTIAISWSDGDREEEDTLFTGEVKV